MRQASGPSGGAPAARAPESYTPGHLVERILTSRSALEGERKQVTVLFADLKSSMKRLVERDPEEARKILDPVLELPLLHGRLGDARSDRRPALLDSLG